MRNNVYIGNRYVPIFADPVEWDNLREYEPLTIVTYQGTAYTSKKTVPVGTALSNTEYWVVTGNYNAQVEQYRQEVSALSDDVDGLETSIGAVDDKVDALATIVGGVNKPTNMKNVVFVGDSYATASEGWPYWVKSFFGLAASECYTSAQGSTGFGYASGGVTFDTLLTSAYNATTQEWRNNVSHVIVCGGANDVLATQQQVVDGIQTFVTHARQYFPNCRVSVGFIGNIKDATKKHLVQQVCSWYNHLSNIVIYTYLSGVEYVLHDYSLLSSDGVHPTANGYRCLGNAISNAILTGHWSQMYPRRSAGTIGATGISYTPRTVYESLDNGMVRLSINNDMLYTQTADTITDNTAIDIGTISSNYAYGNYYQECGVTVPLKIHANNTWTIGEGVVVLYQNKLQLFVNIKGSSGGTTYPTCDMIVVGRFCMNIPTLLC